MSNVSASSIIGLRYRTTFARVLDSNRKFLDAALRYYELSTTEARIAAEDVLELLSKAIVCAVLGKICAQRNRVLELLHQVRLIAVILFIRTGEGAVMITYVSVFAYVIADMDTGCSNSSA